MTVVVQTFPSERGEISPHWRNVAPSSVRRLSRQVVAVAFLPFGDLDISLAVRSDDDF